MAIMIQQYVAMNVDFAILASFLSGVFIFMLGVLNLGELFTCNRLNLCYKVSVYSRQTFRPIFFI